METTTGLKPTHPLADITYIRNWKEWKEAWASTTLADVRYGLLHLGFGVETDSEEDRVERILFYLDVADGYADVQNFQMEHERHLSYDGFYRNALTALRGKGLSQLRRKIAEKAFMVVAMHVFKPLRQDEFRDHGEGWSLIVNPRLFYKLMWFFRPDREEKRLINFPFVGKQTQPWGVHAEITKGFLMRLCTLGFECQYFVGGERTRQIQRFLKEEGWPKFVQILFYMGETRILLEGKFAGIFDKRCFRKLETLVMEDTFWFDLEQKFRNPKTLEEAIYAGSRAAATLRILQTKKAEQERFEKIREAEQTRRDAEQKLADLTGAQKG